MGERCKLPSEVLGRTPVEIEFRALYTPCPEKKTSQTLAIVTRRRVDQFKKFFIQIFLAQLAIK